MVQDLDTAALADIGGFFALRTGRPPRAARPLAEAYALVPGGSDPLAVRVGLVTGRIGAPEARVAVSLVQLGLAARIWSLHLGAAVLHGALPDLDPARVHWDPEAATGEDLWLAQARMLPADPEAVDRAVRGRHLDPLAAVLHRRYGLAEGLLHGNSGSALAGALRELDRWAHRTGRPEAAARARALGDALFADPVLAATGHREGTAFRRRSCCLYYRVPGGGVCGDCCFTRPPGTAGPGPVRGS
ncbi:(2Fe-2S)-binding protein [Streptomyces sp. SCSIO ZS0520]|uniref:(2Fe-2S)-binding protein n=1 Tax=Streptomyces sp. SCSIO ZS0520 TaxID=2892996 RepID=UPI0021DAAC06|nr:(2Fe-2S)-binding protein [Streptomyces sp. SCSIO ZS0520]